MNVNGRLQYFLLIPHLNCGLENEARISFMSYEHSKCLSKLHEVVGIIFSGKLAWPAGSQAAYHSWALMTRAVVYKFVLDKSA